MASSILLTSRTHGRFAYEDFLRVTRNHHIAFAQGLQLELTWILRSSIAGSLVSTSDHGDYTLLLPPFPAIAKMSDFRPQLCSGVRHRDATIGAPLEAVQASNPSDWVKCTQTPSSQFYGLSDLTGLELKVSIMESQLAEHSNDITEAHAAIYQLLRLNTCAASPCRGQDSCNAGAEFHKDGSARIMGEMFKDLVIALVDKLQTNGGITDSKRNHHTGTGGSFNSTDGDLLELGGEKLGCDTLLAEKGVSPDRGMSKVLKGFEGRVQVQPLQELTAVTSKSLMSEADAFHEGVFSPKTDAFPALPYVTRFGQEKTQKATDTEVSASGMQNQSFHNQDLKTMLSAVDDSESGLSGSTQYAGSESNGLTSLNSSFTSSEDETEEYVSPSRKVDQMGVEDEQKNISCTFLSGSVHSTNASATSDARAVQILTQDTQNLELDTAALFMPRWPQKPIVLSPDERQGAVFIHQLFAGGEEYRFPDVFKYGICFRPRKRETNVFRTVVVNNLPRGLRLFTLLQRVKDGAIEDARLLDTVSIDGCFSAMITFVHEHGAKAFDHGARHNRLEFDGVGARVILLPTPTYPMPKNLSVAIINHGYTRCIEIQNFPRGIKPAELERELRVYGVMTTHRIESRRMRSDGTLELCFTAIKYAGRAYGHFIGSRRYSHCKIAFLPDPCSEPWDAASSTLSIVHDQAKPLEQQPKIQVPTTTDATTCAADDTVDHEPEAHGPGLDFADLGIVEAHRGGLKNVEFEGDPHIVCRRHPGRNEAQGNPYNACNQQ